MQLGINGPSWADISCQHGQLSEGRVGREGARMSGLGHLATSLPRVTSATLSTKTWARSWSCLLGHGPGTWAVSAGHSFQRWLQVHHGSQDSCLKRRWEDADSSLSPVPATCRKTLCSSLVAASATTATRKWVPVSPREGPPTQSRAAEAGSRRPAAGQMQVPSVAPRLTAL